MISYNEKKLELTDENMALISRDSVVAYIIVDGNSLGKEGIIYIFTLKMGVINVYKGTNHSNVEFQKKINNILPPIESDCIGGKWIRITIPFGYGHWHVGIPSFIAEDFKCNYSKDQEKNPFYRIYKAIVTTVQQHERDFTSHMILRPQPSAEMKQRLIFMVDCCGGMYGERICALNNSFYNLIPELAGENDNHPNCSLELRVISYSTGAKWMSEKYVPIDDFCWEDLEPSGVVDLGQAFLLLSKEFEDMDKNVKEQIAPVVVLISFRQPTDDYIKQIDRFNKTKWSKKATKLAIYMSEEEADFEALERFTGCKEMIVPACKTISLIDLLSWDSINIHEQSIKLEDSALMSLKQIVNRYPKVWENTRLLKSLLMDYYPQEKLLRNLLLACAEEAIPQEVFLMHEYTNTDIHRLSKILSDSHGCSEQKSEEIVRLWIDAFNVSAEGEQERTLTNQEIEKLRFDEIEDLPVRVYTQLKRAGINTVEDLLRPQNEEMMGVRTLGRKTLEIVLDKLKELGWCEEVEISKQRDLKESKESSTRGMEDSVMGRRQLPINQELKEKYENNLEHTHVGRDKCDQLREIRMKIAEANGIDFEPAECHHTGPCLGTCPACDAEIQYIDAELQKKRERGEEIILNGLAADDIKKSGCNTDPDVFDGVVDGGLSTFEIKMDDFPMPSIDDVTGSW